MYKNVHFNLVKHKIPCWVLSCSQASFYSCFFYIYFLAKNFLAMIILAKERANNNTFMSKKSRAIILW